LSPSLHVSGIKLIILPCQIMDVASKRGLVTRLKKMEADSKRELKILNAKIFGKLQKSILKHAELKEKYFSEGTGAISIDTEYTPSVKEYDRNPIIANLPQLQSDNIYVAQRINVDPYDYHQSVELWILQFYIQNKMRITADIKHFSKLIRPSSKKPGEPLWADNLKILGGLISELNHTSDIIRFNIEDDLLESLGNISWGVESDNENEGLPTPKDVTVPKDNDSRISNKASVGKGDAESVIPKKSDTKVKSNQGFLYVPDFASIRNNCGDVNSEEITVPFKKVAISELPPSEANYVHSFLSSKPVSGYTEGVQSELHFNYKLYSVQHLKTIYRGKNEESFLNEGLTIVL